MREPGFYWAKRFEERTIVEVHERCLNRSTYCIKQYIYAVGTEQNILVPDDCWGPRVERPEGES